MAHRASSRNRRRPHRRAPSAHAPAGDQGFPPTPRRTSRIHGRRWRTIGLFAGAGVVASVALAQLQPPATRNLPMYVLAGLVLGAVVAPVLEPGLFRAPVLWQAGLGAVGGGLLALAAGAPAGVVVAAAFSGAVLGALARYWVNYV